MIKTNEGEKERIRERLAEIREEFMTKGILENPKAEELIRESNNLNVRLKMLGG